MNTRESLKINGRGHLEIGGCDTVDLAKKFGTPLYVLDEKYIREVANAYKSALSAEYGNYEVAYAAKAFCAVAVFKLAKQLDLCADVVSGGEFYTALKAGFDTSKLYFHGNNKLDCEIELAIANGIGTVVVESADEIEIINRIAGNYNRVQKVMLRVNPGVEAHTHHFIQTARTDSKFGVQLGGDLPKSIIQSALKYNNIAFDGLHMHIGSQIFDTDAYCVALEIITDFMAKLKTEGIVVNTLNIGGGLGINYTDADPLVTPRRYAYQTKLIVAKLLELLSAKSLAKPKLVIEPGRSIIGEAGITLYTVGAIKEIPEVRKYVAVDGGMFDNPRHALYGAQYSAVIANKADKPSDDIVTIAGKCCESGDLISEKVPLQRAERGDILAVFSTGAYNYSMASNYNSNLVPPVVFVKDGVAQYAVKPQSYDDLLRNNVVPDWLDN